jgi:hypothetical protein
MIISILIQKVFFVQFSIPELDKNKRKLLENDDEEKIISCRDTRKKNG